MTDTAIPDLGAIRARNEARRAVPPYDPGTPELAMRIGVDVLGPAPSFRDALDRVATNLHEDGWTVLEVKQCVMLEVMQDEANGRSVAVFQVTVRVCAKGDE